MGNSITNTITKTFQKFSGGGSGENFWTRISKGAKNLFNDEELMPIKGQITILLPQPEVDYMVDVVHHMVPRKDGILLAGTWEPGVETLEPNPEAIQRVMNSHMEFFEKMR